MIEEPIQFGIANKSLLLLLLLFHFFLFADDTNLLYANKNLKTLESCSDKFRVEGSL